jgi:LysM repeat protein
MNLYPKNCPNGFFPYIIRYGDTLAQLANHYQIYLSDLILSNPNVEPNDLIIGQQICIPSHIQHYPACPSTNYYVVRKKDVFTDIARYFNVSPNQLLFSNYGIDPNDLYEDQILCIPIAPSPVVLVADLKQNRLFVIQTNQVVKSYFIHPSQENIPTGNYIILNKQVDPDSNGTRVLGLSEAGLTIRDIHQAPLPSSNDDKSLIMADKDIFELFNLVTVGTPVTIT